MSDATVRFTAPDTNAYCVGLDVFEIRVRKNSVAVVYQKVLSNGEHADQFVELLVTPPNLAPCIQSFCQAAPRKKLTEWLINNGYLPGCEVI